MLRVLGGFGLYVGAPSMATWFSLLYLPFVEHFDVLFLVSVAALVVAILPRLQAGAAQSTLPAPDLRD